MSFVFFCDFAGQTSTPGALCLALEIGALGCGLFRPVEPAIIRACSMSSTSPVLSVAEVAESCPIGS